MPGKKTTPKNILVLFENQLNKAIVSSGTAKEILLKYEIEPHKITIIVNRDQRPSTNLAGSQGDHVTAYTVLLQTICNLIDGEEIHDAPKILHDATSCFFNDLESLEFKSSKTGKVINFATKLQEVELQFFHKKTRNKLTDAIKTIKSSDEVVNGQLKNSLAFIKTLKLKKLTQSIKRSNQGLFAQLVVDLGEQILKKYNHKSTAALPKLKADHEIIIGEGSRVKTAMLNLKVLNKLLNLTLNLTSKELIAEFKITCSNLIKSTFPQIQNEISINTKFSNILNDLLDIDQNLNINLNNLEEYLAQIDINAKIKPKIIGKLFNDLFDFKQSRIRKIQPNEYDGQVVDDGAKIALANPESCLYEVVSRHAKFMFKAFNNLEILSAELKNNIIDGFHENIIKKSMDGHDNYQGWGEYVMYKSRAGANRFFTKQCLDLGVAEYNKNCPDTKEYIKAVKSRKLKINI